MCVCFFPPMSCVFVDNVSLTTTAALTPNTTQLIISHPAAQTSQPRSDLADPEGAALTHARLFPAAALFHRASL